MDPTASSADTLPPGSRLQNFRIVRQLGRGGFGVIYLATDVSLGHRVAIKEYLPGEIAARVGDSRVQPNHTDHAQLYKWGLDRFVKEARNLVRFRHPNIVRVTALFQENNTAYMVMDFEEGQSLRDHVKDPANRSEEQLKILIKPIAQGLSEVHRQGFIHRDIKPSNLMVREDGSPVLLDFGSARLASRHATHGLTALVSSGYAPLEQYNPESEEQQGPWSDIYALGGVLYYCISQQDPPDSTQRSLAIVNGQLDPLLAATRAGAEKYSHAFLRAIDWSLSVRIADRPQMLGDWIPALFATGAAPDAAITTQRLLDQQTRLVSTPTTTARTESATTLEEDNWDRAMAAAEHRAAQDAGVATQSIQTAPTSPVITGAPAPQKRSFIGWVLGIVAILGVGLAGWFGYEQLSRSLESQQAAVNAQRLAADEALVKAEAARQEALTAMSQQRLREEEQNRLGAERLAAEAARAEQRAIDAKVAEEARLAQQKREAEAAAERDAQAANRLAARNRQQQETLLDEAVRALDVNDLVTARSAFAKASALGDTSARVQTVKASLAAAEVNAKTPVI